MSQQDTGPSAGRGTGPQMRSGISAMSLSDSVYDRLLQQRIIVLGQQVDAEISNRIAAQMLLLAAEDPDKDIELYINSPVARSPTAWPSSTR